MKLARYNHFDPVTSTITGENGYKLPYIFTETIPSDYTDITTIENLNNLGFDVDDNFDWKRVRDLGRGILTVKSDAVTIGVESTPSNILSPNIGDKYEVGASAVKDFRYKEGSIAEWDGSTWIFKSKEEIGYDECTPSEQQVLLSWKLGTHSQRFNTAGDVDTLVGHGLKYHSILSGIDLHLGIRPKRYAYALSMVHNHSEHIMIEITSAGIPENNNGLTITNNPPLSPNVGDKVIVGLDGVGVFDGNEKDLAEWDGAAWLFTKRYWLPAPVMVLSIISSFHPLGLFNYITNGLVGYVDADPISSFGDFFNKTPGSPYHTYNQALEDFANFTSQLPEGLATWKDLGAKISDCIIKGIY